MRNKALVLCHMSFDGISLPHAGKGSRTQDTPRQVRLGVAPDPRFLFHKAPASLRVAACLLAWLSGCQGLDAWNARPAPPPAPLSQPSAMDPLPMQQHEAYPETVTGLFISLADFEDSPFHPNGSQQVEQFRLLGPSELCSRKYAANITRTGAGAMEVHLAPGAQLLFEIPDVHDFRPYTLLSMAVYSDAPRDDLQLTLTSGRGSWTSPRMLLKKGWTTVAVDIQRLKDSLNMAEVKSMRLAFVDAAGPVRFNLDDILLIDNRREIEPCPPGVTLRKNGLDYSLKLPGAPAMTLAQSPDGLWRLGDQQPLLELTAPGEPLGAQGQERLSLMGDRRLGDVEVLENNPLRLRMAWTWYFPSRAGEWVSLAVRHVRWQYTFYADGRWVASTELNDSGGEAAGSLRLRFPAEVAWAEDGRGREMTVSDFSTPIGRWNCLWAPPGPEAGALQDNYLRPAKILPALAQDNAWAPGDRNHDGFDESQGCYYLRAKAGHCRFTIQPPPGGVQDAAFHIGGRWKAPPQVSSEGLAIRNTVFLPDGSLLFILAGRVTKPTSVEIVGEPLSLLED